MDLLKIDSLGDNDNVNNNNYVRWAQPYVYLY